MKTVEELKELRDSVKSATDIKDGAEPQIRVLVGMATCGMAAGAGPVLETLTEEIKKRAIPGVTVKKTGCIGICQFEPIVEIHETGKEKVTYVGMTPEKAIQVVNEHIVNGVIADELTVGRATSEDGVTSLDKTSFYKKQKRIALRNCGLIDPEDINEYIATDGYLALGKCLTEYTPQQVIEEIITAGLRGRGGAGVPTGVKWKMAAQNDADQKYVCCNADEGDPGAFMDRSVLEGDPHAIIEAMAIAGYAIGASQGYVYIRAEYPVAVKRLNIAIGQAKELGLLGENILGSGFSFDIELRLGAGAFVCGEETALMTSIEGKRGEPRPRPPFPAKEGVFGKPTVLNNVETLANIPRVILLGSEWFSSMGTEKSNGTKVFALAGKVNNSGLVEVPMGVTLREVVEEIGGGIPKGKKFKAAQTGGPSGGCIPDSKVDVPIDYDNLISIGSMMGSGGLIVMDEDNCMVDIAKFFLEFTVDESCGECSPCRIGTKRMYEMLERITEGKAVMEDLDKLEELCHHIKKNALCGLGQTAPNPVLSTLNYFRDEYEAHIKERRCPAGVCKALLRYFIDDEKCKGCTLCAKVCPAGAITGERKAPHSIDTNLCVKCGECIGKCNFGAIAVR